MQCIYKIPSRSSFRSSLDTSFLLEPLPKQPPLACAGGAFDVGACFRADMTRSDEPSKTQLADKNPRQNSEKISEIHRHDNQHPKISSRQDTRSHTINKSPPTKQVVTTISGNRPKSAKQGHFVHHSKP